jgi:hypothetical protein
LHGSIVIQLVFLLLIPHNPLFCSQVNRALALSRQKQAFWQLRLATISQKSEAIGTASLPIVAPHISPDHPIDADKATGFNPPHNLELMCPSPIPHFSAQS